MKSQHTEEPDAPPRPGGEPDKEGRAPVVHMMHYSRGVSPEVGAVHGSVPSAAPGTGMEQQGSQVLYGYEPYENQHATNATAETADEQQKQQQEQEEKQEQEQKQQEQSMSQRKGAGDDGEQSMSQRIGASDDGASDGAIGQRSSAGADEADPMEQTTQQRQKDEPMGAEDEP